MNHPITLGGLLLSLGVIGGLAGCAFGALMAFAGGMSDAVSEGRRTVNQGCVTFVVGLAVLVGCIVGLAA